MTEKGNYNYSTMKVWNPETLNYTNITGIIQNRIFYPICKECVYNFAHSRMFETPTYINLRKTLAKRKPKHYIYTFITWCHKQRKKVGYPNSCKYKTTISETDKTKTNQNGLIIKHD